MTERFKNLEITAPEQQEKRRGVATPPGTRVLVVVGPHRGKVLMSNGSPVIIVPLRGSVMEEVVFSLALGRPDPTPVRMSDPVKVVYIVQPVRAGRSSIVVAVPDDWRGDVAEVAIATLYELALSSAEMVGEADPWLMYGKRPTMPPIRIKEMRIRPSNPFLEGSPILGKMVFDESDEPMTKKVMKQVLQQLGVPSLVKTEKEDDD